MKKLKLYLAHCFHTRKTVRKIELQIEKEFNVELVNPFYDLDREDIKKLDKGIELNRTKKDCQFVRQRDLNNILASDGLLAIIFDLDKMIGTLKEMCFAYENGIKVYLVSYDVYARNHLWNVVESYLIFSSIKQFILYLEYNGYKKE